jgi:hypothetical protein
VRAGEPLQALRTAVRSDEPLWELLETPLMLWVAMLAYRDVPLASLQGNTVEQRQRHLLAQFVKAMFRRRASQRGYSPGQSHLEIQRWNSRVADRIAGLPCGDLPRGIRQLDSA